MINKIVKLFSNKKINDIKNIDSSRGDADKRFAHIICFDDDTKIVVKITNNSFTTPERVLNWQRTVEIYNKNGIYCPLYLKSKNGKYAEYLSIDNEQFLVYAEEYKKYNCVNEFSENIDKEVYSNKALQSIGKISNCTDFQVPFVSAYCMYDVFCEEDETDENFESGKLIYDIIRKDFPKHIEQIENIWQTYLEKRRKFELIYHALPKAVFQSDINPTNIMLNDKLEFVGLIDFNLSGVANILYYSFCECRYGINTDDIEILNTTEFLEKWDNTFINNFNQIKKYYHFTNEEKQAFELAYNVITPFLAWMCSGLLQWAIRENKIDTLKNILDFIEFNLNRTGVNYLD